MRRQNEVAVGLVVTIAVALTIMGTLWLVRGGLTSGYPLYARFPWGPGLKQGQPVVLSGVSIGYVGEIDLKRDGTLVVTMRIKGGRNGYRVPKGTVATVEPNGLFGDMMIALRPANPNNEAYANGDTLPTGKPTTSMNDILARLDTVGNSVRTVTDAFELEMVQRGGISDMRKAIQQTSIFMAQLNAIAAQQSIELSRTTAALRRTVSAIDSASIDSTVNNLQTASANMAALTSDLRQTNVALNGLLSKLDRGEGTAGKLLTDTLLYRDVRSLVSRLDSLTTDFQKHPKKYVNLSIF
jgi:phospholipid/cholesterol/gamma-HCH transport system substrate-binding protein